MTGALARPSRAQLGSCRWPQQLRIHLRFVSRHHFTACGKTRTRTGFGKGTTSSRAVKSLKMCPRFSVCGVLFAPSTTFSASCSALGKSYKRGCQVKNTFPCRNARIIFPASSPPYCRQFFFSCLTVSACRGAVLLAAERRGSRSSSSSSSSLRLHVVGCHDDAIRF